MPEPRLGTTKQNKTSESPDCWKGLPGYATTRFLLLHLILYGFIRRMLGLVLQVHAGLRGDTIRRHHGVL